MSEHVTIVSTMHVMLVGTGFENWEQNPPPVPGQFLPRFWLRFLLFAGRFPGQFLVDFQKPIVKIGFENWF